MRKMSSETLLVGDITLKEGVGYDRARKLAEDLKECTEVYTVLEGYVNYNFYLSNIFKNTDMKGKALIIYNDFSKTFSISYSDLSWSSHIYDDMWDELKRKLYENREIIRDVSMSLWYLTESDRSIYIAPDAKDGEYGSWDAIKSGIGEDDSENEELSP